MNLSKVDLNLLVALDALLSEKNVTRAAERIFLSQPAMSGALARLREFFGDELIVRVGRKMELTPHGESLVEPVREILALIDSTTSAEISFDPKSSERTFSVVLSDYSALVLMPYVLQKLSELAPNITINNSTVSSKTIAEIDRGDVDLVIAEPGWVDEGHPSKLLFADGWVCCIAKDRHPNMGETLDKEYYQNATHMQVRFGAGERTSFENQSLEQLGIKRKIGVAVPNITLLPYLIQDSSLVATVNEKVAAIFNWGNDVDVLPLPFEMPSLCEVMYWHQRFDMDPGHEWLRNLFISVASELDKNHQAP